MVGVTIMYFKDWFFLPAIDTYINTVFIDSVDKTFEQQTSSLGFNKQIALC